MPQWFPSALRVPTAALPLVLCTMVATGACSRGDASRARYTTTDSAGVQIVENRAADDSLPWRFERMAQIGGADSGVQAFDQVGWYNVATDGRGQIAVFDRDNGNRVQVFDSLGRHLRSLGARGGGPGEVEYADAVSMDAVGNVSVYDRSKAAIVRWAADGAVLPELRGFDARGSIWGKALVRDDTVYTALSRADSARSVRIVERWSMRDTVPLDSLVSTRAPMVRFSCVGLAIPPLLSSELAYAVSDSGLAITAQSQYVVDVYRDGRRVRSVRRAMTPVPATIEDASKLFPEGMRVRFGGPKECVVPARELGEKLGMAPTIPLVRNMAWSPDGSLWVERYTFEGDPPQTDVFDARGGYVGTAYGRSLPLGFLGPDVVLFAEPNADDGSSRVGVFRIQRRR